MVIILREADRTSVAEAAKKNKVREQATYAWRRHSGAIEPTDVERLRSIELENARLRMLLAECDLDIEVLMETNRQEW